MSKRDAIGVMMLVTGFLLFSTIVTAPVGAILVLGGAYLLALPRIDGQERSVDRSPGRRERT